MDALVKWVDGTQNVVNSKELVILGKYNVLKTGARIKMWYMKRWYFGKVVAVEEKLDDDDSEDDLPLSSLKNINEIRSDMQRSLGEIPNKPLGAIQNGKILYFISRFCT
nr:unnamed protein product [Callosobruchus chinensis]CAH7750557.1 unnamed protein product [Callosobruchus chinensis]CAH7753576.1 unnamed protein product [Callosobruchus chinensis]CAH7761328.1 unnamed protein product [Callosobruchus chinensis]